MLCNNVDKMCPSVGNLLRIIIMSKWMGTDCGWCVVLVCVCVVRYRKLQTLNKDSKEWKICENVRAKMNVYSNYYSVPRIFILILFFLKRREKTESYVWKKQANKRCRMRRWKKGDVRTCVRRMKGRSKQNSNEIFKSHTVFIVIAMNWI